MTVLVCGATGTTGSEALRQLRATGAAIRAMTRNEASAARLRADGIEAVVADLATPDRLSVALEEVDSVYVATSASPQLAEHEGTLARAAARAGVRHLVKLSVIGRRPTRGSPSVASITRPSRRSSPPACRRRWCAPTASCRTPWRGPRNCPPE